MTLDPLIPWPLTVLIAVALAALVIWRLVVDPARRLRWALRGVAALAVCLGLLGPALYGGSSRTAATDVNVWFVVDTTTSANARDHQGDLPRIDGYREDVDKIVEEMAGARFSVITFDQQSRVTMPLTTDTTAVQTSMETLSPEISMYSGGSSTTAAQDTLRTALERSQERFPNRARVVFYLGDGEQTANQEPAPFDVGDLVDGGAVLGYGTAEGGPMARTELDGSAGEDVKDANGDVGISVIDEDALGQVADQLGVPYVHRDGGDIGPAMAEADPGQVVEEAGDEVEHHTSVAWACALLAILLLGLDVWLMNRDSARLRKAARS